MLIDSDLFVEKNLFGLRKLRRVPKEASETALLSFSRETPHQTETLRHQVLCAHDLMTWRFTRFLGDSRHEENVMVVSHLIRATLYERWIVCYNVISMVNGAQFPPQTPSTYF